MSGASIKSLGVDRLLAPEHRRFCVGHIFQITPEGKALVDYPGNLMGPIKARSVVGGPRTGDDNRHEGIPVLLLFEKGDPSLPIIVGIIHDTLYPTPHEGATVSLERPDDIVVDGKKRVFDAEEEILLRCGKSSVSLRKDGKIVVKGTQIVSRASGTQKIKGASVKIN
jgi:Domain of unknown function (DUF6484)